MRASNINRVRVLINIKYISKKFKYFNTQIIARLGSDLCRRFILDFQSFVSTSYDISSRAYKSFNCFEINTYLTRHHNWFLASNSYINLRSFKLCLWMRSMKARTEKSRIIFPRNSHRRFELLNSNHHTYFIYRINNTDILIWWNPTSIHCYIIQCIH